MATFESLPGDICFLILSSLPTIRSLRSLCQASEVYDALFLSHKTSIESAVSLREALEHYSSEAVWLAQYHDRLRGSIGDPDEEVPLALLAYMSYPNPPPPIKLSNFEQQSGPDFSTQAPVEQFSKAIESELRNIGQTPDSNVRPRNYSGPALRKESREKIARCHKTIIDIYERFVKQEVSRRRGSSTYKLPGKRQARRMSSVRPALENTYLWVSPKEEERIIEALYRFFVGFSVIGSLTSNSYHPSVNYAIRAWGLWGAIGVRAVRDFLENKICRSQSRDPTKLQLDTHDHNFLLLYEFPENLSMWIDPETPLQRLEARANTIRKQLETNPAFFYGEDGWRRFDTMYISLDLFMTHPRGHDFKVESAEYCYRDGEKVRFLEPLQIARQTHKLRCPDKDPEVFLVPAEDNLGRRLARTGRFDLHAALWDNETLKVWGYGYCKWRIHCPDSDYYYVFGDDYIDEAEYWDPNSDVWEPGLWVEGEEDVEEKFDRYRDQTKWRGERGGKRGKGTRTLTVMKQGAGGSRSGSKSRPEKNVQSEVGDIDEYFRELAVLDSTSRGDGVDGGLPALPLPLPKENRM
ncbi:hypothetical protein TWF281_009708 [Arthrobotrys megalospora]